MIECSLCHYSDAYVLVTGNIVVKKRNTADTDDIALGAITQVSIVHRLKIVERKLMIFVDYANFINITMPMYNLIEYSDNYSDTSGRL